MKLKNLFSAIGCIGMAMLINVCSFAQSAPDNLPAKRAFAIVVDQATYDFAKEQIKSYKQLVESRGLDAYVLAERWENPDVVRAALLALYEQNVGLEGTVLIGDIPIPMIRDAQHLTSTFKMPQNIDWKRSSVPSDRFYDDFDLKFDFIKQDSTVSSYFYYSLSPDSPQRIEMDIYSARIKPPKTGSAAEYHQKISDYLDKIVKEDISSGKLDQGITYTGHGYHSESMTSWAGEQLALKGQVPDLFVPGGALKSFDFRMGEFMKFPLLQELQRDDLDFALLHSHGSDDAQLLNGYPLASNPQPSIENIKRYLRSKIQDAESREKDVEQAITKYQEYLDVPRSWMADALLDSVKVADSIFNASTDIYISDLDAITINARMVILDACDNGSFHLEDYIAAHYPFGVGKNVVTLASSIGILQDIWPTRMLGLLSLGVSPGRWLQETAYLETHLFGDPTFIFQGKKNIAELLASENWTELEKVSNPDLKGFLLKQKITQQGKKMTSELQYLVRNSPFETLRMEALWQLRTLGGSQYHQALNSALSDPYEMIRRQALYMVEEVGSDEFIPGLVRLAFEDTSSERVQYKIGNVLDKMGSEKVLAEINNYQSQHPGKNNQMIAEELIRSQEYTLKKLDRDYAGMGEESFDAKSKKFNLRTLRAYRYHQALDQVLDLISDESEELELRLIGIEALSWFNESYQKDKIIQRLQSLLSEEQEVIVKESKRSLSILTE